ncbi:hypothetical protein OIU76_003829 [Salix suchowensis]|nr:hypothetical protein OIU76_003829 [Salix suchowensis]KAJ6347212.1 hypothetical protein OIU76_003829 [Salix suchowensis]
MKIYGKPREVTISTLISTIQFLLRTIYLTVACGFLPNHRYFQAESYGLTQQHQTARDVEVIDDDIAIISPNTFDQARKKARRNPDAAVRENINVANQAGSVPQLPGLSPDGAATPTFWIAPDGATAPTFWIAPDGATRSSIGVLLPNLYGRDERSNLNKMWSCFL